MKVIILAGGFGTRITEESSLRPKPMVEIGDKPILWHIMKYYSSFGFNDFIVCAGYRSYYIKEYFLNYFSHRSDFTINLRTGIATYHTMESEDWNVTILDTGLEALTGERVLAAINFFPENQRFCLTYGDGLSDINLEDLLRFHSQSLRPMTVTGIPAKGKYGLLRCESGLVTEFIEKPESDTELVNGGFFIFERSALSEFLNCTRSLSLETDILPTLVKQGKLALFPHYGFWQSMDTLREKYILEDLWLAGAPWKRW